MPFFKTGAKLVYYAHVPKCGGSAVEHFSPCAKMRRFGGGTFHPRPRRSNGLRGHRLYGAGRGATLVQNIAPTYQVRHPVARVVSAYHFQMEEEGRISKNVSFSDWLEDLGEAHAENPYAYDNHLRPMNDIVPEGAHVFYLEHGLDALVPWFDDLLGNKTAPRAIHRINERSSGGEKVQPSTADLAQIERVYSADFERFGYKVGDKLPAAPAPVLSADIIAERDAELKAAASPMAKVGKLAGKIKRKIGG